MQDSQLLQEGLSLMGLGMGFVFVFLTFLVIVTTLMSKAIGRYFPEPVAPVGGPSAPAPHHDEALMAVISTAVHRYRRRHRR